ncbi:MAG: 50S ribosomal protein L6 [Candidatus Aenigmarchaeota archaeon]|nr:50S ribosomal protein L6 [Candidatus Aenigmarchaeota archaeon]
MYSKEFLIPANISIETDGGKVRVSGAKGQLERTFKLAFGIKIEKTENKVKISSELSKREVKAMIGTMIAHIRNMAEGVTNGYTYRMKIVYSHFPMTVKLEGRKVVTQNFIGERTSRVADIIGDTQVKIDGLDVTITGINLEDVGQTASNIEQSCRIVGFDKRRFSDGIYLVSGKK